MLRMSLLDGPLLRKQPLLAVRSSSARPCALVFGVNLLMAVPRLRPLLLRAALRPRQR